MYGVQGERLIGQRLGFQPVGVDYRLRMFDQRVGQDGAGKSIFFIQFVCLTQKLNRFRGFPLRKQFLALGGRAAGFSMALHAILRQLLQFNQLGIVIIGKFGGCTSRQIQRASVVARTLAGFDLLHEPRLGNRGRRLVALFLQSLEPRRRVPCAPKFLRDWEEKDSVLGVALGRPGYSDVRGTSVNVSYTFTMVISFPSLAQQRSRWGSSWAVRRASSDFQ